MAIELVETDEVTLAVEQTGEGVPLLLVAGGFMDMDQWLYQFEALAEGRRVIRFDQRGTGQSSMTVDGYTIQQFALDTIALIEQLGAAPCVLFGSSVGGLVGIEIAITRPELISKLIVAGTPAGVRGEATPIETQMAMLRGAALPMEQAAAALQDILFATDFHDEHPAMLDEAVEKRRQYPPPPLALMGPLQSTLTYDPLEALTGFNKPVLILQGGSDRIVPPGNAAILEAALSNAKTVNFPGMGHALVIEANEAVNATVHDFLREV